LRCVKCHSSFDAVCAGSLVFSYITKSKQTSKRKKLGILIYKSKETREYSLIKSSETREVAQSSVVLSDIGF